MIVILYNFIQNFYITDFKCLFKVPDASQSLNKYTIAEDMSINILILTLSSKHKPSSESLPHL